MKSYLLLMLILSISLVSSTISVSPNSFDLNGYPGQVFQRNITITTDKLTQVFIGTSSNLIKINPNTFEVSGSREVELNLTFYEDSPVGTYNFSIEALEIVENQPISPPSSSGSGGGGGSGGTQTILKNVTVEVPKYIDREVIVEKQVPIEAETPQREEIIGKTPYLAYIFVFLVVGGLVSYIMYLKKQEEYDYTDERRSNENE